MVSKNVSSPYAACYSVLHMAKSVLWQAASPSGGAPTNGSAAPTTSSGGDLPAPTAVPLTAPAAEDFRAAEAAEAQSQRPPSASPRPTTPAATAAMPRSRTPRQRHLPESLAPTMEQVMAHVAALSSPALKARQPPQPAADEPSGAADAPATVSAAHPATPSADDSAVGAGADAALPAAEDADSSVARQPQSAGATEAAPSAVESADGDAASQQQQWDQQQELPPRASASVVAEAPSGAGPTLPGDATAAVAVAANSQPGNISASAADGAPQADGPSSESGQAAFRTLPHLQFGTVPAEAVRGGAAPLGEEAPALAPAVASRLNPAAKEFCPGGFCGAVARPATAPAGERVPIQSWPLPLRRLPALFHPISGLLVEAVRRESRKRIPAVVGPVLATQAVPSVWAVA